ELFGALLEAPGVELLDGGTDQRVQPPPLGLEQRCVGDVLSQRVTEDVFDVAEAGFLVDELDPLQLAEALLESIVEFGHPPEERARELASDHRRRLDRPNSTIDSSRASAS